MPDETSGQDDTVRFTVALPKDLLDRLDERREAESRKIGVRLTRNQFFAWMGEQLLKAGEGV